MWIKDEKYMIKFLIIPEHIWHPFSAIKRIDSFQSAWLTPTIWVKGSIFTHSLPKNLMEWVVSFTPWPVYYRESSPPYNFCRRPHGPQCLCLEKCSLVCCRNYLLQAHHEHSSACECILSPPLYCSQVTPLGHHILVSFPCLLGPMAFISLKWVQWSILKSALFILRFQLQKCVNYNE